MSVVKTGWPQTQAGITALRGLINDKATRAAVRAAGEIFREEEELEAPVLDEKTAKSTSLDPGEMKAGIRINSVRKIGSTIIQAQIGPRKGTRRAAHLVEFGHRLVKGGKSGIGPRDPIGPGREIGEVRPHPFLRPSYEVSWRKAVEAFAVALKNQLGRYVK